MDNEVDINMYGEEHQREGYEDYMRRRSREEDEKMKKLHEMMDADDKQAEEYNRQQRKKEIMNVLKTDTIDLLARDAIEWHRDSLLDDIIDFEDDRGYVHKDDYRNAHVLVKHFNAVAEYFGIEAKGTLVRRVERGLDFKDTACPICGLYEGKHKMDCHNG